MIFIYLHKKNAPMLLTRTWAVRNLHTSVMVDSSQDVERIWGSGMDPTGFVASVKLISSTLSDGQG